MHTRTCTYAAFPSRVFSLIEWKSRQRSIWSETGMKHRLVKCETHICFDKLLHTTSWAECVVVRLQFPLPLPLYCIFHSDTLHAQPNLYHCYFAPHIHTVIISFSLFSLFYSIWIVLCLCTTIARAFHCPRGKNIVFWIELNWAQVSKMPQKITRQHSGCCSLQHLSDTFLQRAFVKVYNKKGWDNDLEPDSWSFVDWWVLLLDGPAQTHVEDQVDLWMGSSQDSPSCNRRRDLNLAWQDMQTCCS